MLKALRSGEVLCFKADRVLPGSDDGVPVQFFGEDVLFPPGPAAIALTARARAVVVSVFRVGPARYRVEADRLDLTGGDAKSITAAYAAMLEKHLRGRSHQWFNFFPYWPADAPASAAQPEIVPLAARAAEHALWGGVASSTGLLLLDRLLGASLVWGAVDGAGLVARAVAGVGSVSWGVVAGIAASVLGIVLGAEKQPDGRRNARAHVQAILAPTLGIGGLLMLAAPLISSGVASSTLTAAAVTWVWALGIATVGPRARKAAFAAVALTCLAALGL
jgi:hypothetical protein